MEVGEERLKVVGPAEVGELLALVVEGMDRNDGRQCLGSDGCKSETWATLTGHARESLRFLDHVLIKEKSG